MAVIVSGQGDIQGVTSLNSGSFTFRNILYNGWVNTPDEINQRNLTFAGVSDGNYFADRWKRVSSTTMTQIVEEGNYIPNRTYTLSGTNVTTTQVTAPSSGNWDWGTVPSTASLVQLELGDTASSFEYRPKGIERSLCQRYYCTVDGEYRFDAKTGDGNGTGDFTVAYMWYFPVSMRTLPTLTTLAESSIKSGTVTWVAKSSDGARGTFKYLNPNDLTTRLKAAVVGADAEL
jgi:hypothetical protein